MVRHYKRKTSRQNWSTRDLKSAIQEVLKANLSIKKASEVFGVPFTTLHSYVNDVKNNKIALNDSFIKKDMGQFKSIFNQSQELELVTYIKDMESRLFGLNMQDLKKLAFNLAEANKIKHPFCTKTGLAGQDWVKGFLRRHPELSIRAPEPTSAARAIGFNKPVVMQFFELLLTLIQKYNFGPDRIYNVDETGLSCVAKSQGKIIATKGRKQVGKLSSAERGQNITATICFSASGHYVPPLLIFPRVRLNPLFLDGTPPSTYGVAHQSGWMQSEIFLEWMHHFIKHTNPSMNNPVLLLLDGHSTHVKNIPVIDLAKKNHVHILCFPPHTTHKLQPLDVSFMRPLSVYYSQEVNTFLVNHPGRVVTIYDIGKLFGLAYNKSATINNAVAGFKKTGICPYNSNVFTDVDFVAASITDRSLSPDTVNISDQSIPNDTPLAFNEIAGINQFVINNVSLASTIKIDQEEPTLSPATISLIDQYVYQNPSLSAITETTPFISSLTDDKTIFEAKVFTPESSLTDDKTIFEASVPPESANNFSISPKDILRIPHGSRSKRNKSIHRGKTAVITGTPYKKELQENKKNKNKNSYVKEKKLKKKTSRQLFCESPEKRKCSLGFIKAKNTCVSTLPNKNDTDECMYCTEPYTGSKSREKWARCIGCAKWCHELCGGVEDWTTFICDFCRTNIAKN